VLCHARFQKRGADEKRSLSDLRVALDFLSDLGLPRWTVDLASVARGSEKLLMLFAVFLYPILVGRSHVVVSPAVLNGRSEEDVALVDRLKAELIEARKADVERDELMQELDRTLSTAEVSMRKAQELQSELDALKQKSVAETEAWQEELKKALSSAEDALEQVLEEHQENDNLRAEIEVLKKQSNKTSTEELLAQHEQLTSEKVAANAMLEQMRRDCEELVKLNNAVSDEAKRQAAEFAREQQEMERQLGEMDTQKKQSDEVTTKYEETKRRLVELEQNDVVMSELQRLSELERQTEALRVAAEADLQIAVALAKEVEVELKLRDEERAEMKVRLANSVAECNVARAERANALSCVEEAAQEAIANDVRLSKLESAKLAAEERNAELEKQLEDANREMHAVLASNATLATEMVRLDEGLQEKDVEALIARNKALATQLMTSERERAALMNELESALQMTQGLSMRVESDEVERLKEELRDSRTLLEGLQTAAEEATAQAEKYFELMEAREVELSAVTATMQSSKLPPPDRMSAAILVAQPLLKNAKVDSFPGASLLETEAVACAVMDALVYSKEWNATRMKTATLFASLECFTAFVCNVAMWSKESACCAFLLLVWKVSAQEVAWLLWTRSQLYCVLGLVSNVSLRIENEVVAESICHIAFGRSDFLKPKIGAPLNVHEVAVQAAHALMKSNDDMESIVKEGKVGVNVVELYKRVDELFSANQELVREKLLQQGKYRELKIGFDKMAAQTEQLSNEKAALSLKCAALVRQLNEEQIDGSMVIEKMVYNEDVLSAEEKRANMRTSVEGLESLVAEVKRGTNTASSDEHPNQRLVFSLEDVSVEEIRAQIMHEVVNSPKQKMVYSDEELSVEEKRAQSSEQKRPVEAVVENVFCFCFCFLFFF
jgi:hypothetical protein